MHAKVGVADARDNGNFMMKASSASVLSQLSKLALGSACFALIAVGAINGADIAKKALFTDSLNISPRLVSWTSDLHPAFKSSITNISLQSPLDAVAAESFSDNVSSDVHQGLRRIAHLEVAQRQALKRANTIHVRQVVAKAELVRDEVKVSQSAVELTQAPVSSPVLTEAEKLQSVQSVLVSRFMLAMNDAPKANTQIAQAAPSTLSSNDSLDTQAKIESVLKLISSQDSSKAVNKPVRLKKKEEPTVAVVEKQEEITDSRPKAENILVAKESAPLLKTRSNTATPASGVVSTQAKAVNTQQMSALARTSPLTPLIETNDAVTPPATAPPATEILSNNESKPAAVLVEPTSSVVTSTAHSNSAVVSMAQSAGQMWAKAGYSKPAPQVAKEEYSQQTSVLTQSSPKTSTQETALLKSTLGKSPLNTPAVIPAAVPLPAKETTDKIGSSSSAPYSVSALAATPLRPAFGPLLDRTSRWAFHEAFDWSTSVTGPKVEILSQEGAIADQIQARGQSTGQTLGWRIAKANQHWGTLFWSTPNQEEVPMLNALSAKMLSVKAGVSLQNDAGIVLAKIPAGWSLEFSGRSEHPLVFDRANHNLAPSATEGANGGERYYVFLNASPGEQILYLNHAGGETGALAVPVLGGVMAYVDLTQVEKRTISGRILEAADSSPHGVPGIHVQVVGSGSSTVTGNSGDFHIDNVIAFGDQSLYIEAETQKSFPHRYKLSPSATTHLSLFHLNESQVHEWIGQLEGGVSSESGLILGALPTLAASQEDKKPMVGTRSLANSPTLTPETYTLSGSGQLMVKTPLSGVRSRFISVQVPEGPTLVEVVDKDNRLIWSEITVISPRVLTIVGPY